MGVLVCPSLRFSNRQNWPSVWSPETSRFMTTPASTNSFGSESVIASSLIDAPTKSFALPALQCCSKQ
jgi:hypothetical protein